MFYGNEELNRRGTVSFERNWISILETDFFQQNNIFAYHLIALYIIFYRSSFVMHPRIKVTLQKKCLQSPQLNAQHKMFQVKVNLDDLYSSTIVLCFV